MSQSLIRCESGRFSVLGALAAIVVLAAAACGDKRNAMEMTPAPTAGAQAAPGIVGGGAGAGAMPMAGGSGATSMMTIGGAGSDSPGAGASGAAPDGAGTSGGAAGVSGTAGTESTAAGEGGAVGTAGAAGAPAPACTGKRGAPGLNARSVEGRNVLVYIPSTVDPNTGVPLLFVHHGYTMDGEAMRAVTGFQEIADREGFVVAFPDGVDATWNVGEGACGAGALGSGTADDLAFVKAIIASIEADQCIAREHVFMTGFSMGGYFSHHAGCQMGDVIRGIAPIAGGAYEGPCTGGPIPVMIWQGSADFLIEPMCASGARDIWAARNGCEAGFDTKQVTMGTCEWQRGCPPGGQVVVCMMEGMSHQWPGGAMEPIGAPGYENASEMIWKFFKEQYRL